MDDTPRYSSDYSLEQDAMVNWNRFKEITERLWKNNHLYDKGVCGFQIQPGTKWNDGLSIEEINNLEILFEVTFPSEYKKMLRVINGFDREHVELYEGEKQYFRNCYKYPDDLDIVRPFIMELFDNIKYIKIALKELGLAETKVKGFIPLYSHRALVVFEDLKLTPVISAVGDDVIIYGYSLAKYWKHEFKFKKHF